MESMSVEVIAIIGVIAAIIAPPITVGVPLAVFQWRQNAAMEKRLREDMRESDRRLRGEIAASEDRLRGEIAAVAQSVETAKSELRGEIAASEDRLRGEIAAVAQSVETAKSELRGEIAAVAKAAEKSDAGINHRLDRNDDNVRRLIQDVGVVQGAVLGVSVETSPAETATRN